MNKVQCFLIEKTDLPYQWYYYDENNNKILCDKDDPKAQQGTPVYKRIDNGELLVGTCPGAMFYGEDILPQTPNAKFPYKVGPDGKALVVVLPDNHWWWIDSIPGNGGKWERTGIPPNVTARPSILTHKGEGGKEQSYHGFLTDGVLESC